MPWQTSGNIQGPPGPAGGPGLFWRGPWVSGTTYAQNDVVTNAGASWRRKVTGGGTTAPPSDGTNWEVLADRGAQGIQGIQGPEGPQGPQGIQGPQGQTGSTGSTGSPGAAATVSVASTATGAAGTNASVVNNGSSSAASLAFTIPRGATGLQGQQGIQGNQGPQGIQGPAGPSLGGAEWSKAGTSTTLASTWQGISFGTGVANTGLFTVNNTDGSITINQAGFYLFSLRVSIQQGAAAGTQRIAIGPSSTERYGINEAISIPANVVIQHAMTVARYMSGTITVRAWSWTQSAASIRFDQTAEPTRFSVVRMT